MSESKSDGVIFIRGQRVQLSPVEIVTVLMHHENSFEKVRVRDVDGEEFEIEACQLQALPNGQL